MQKPKFNLLSAAAIALLSFGAVDLIACDRQLSQRSGVDNSAYAKSTGGRTGGGSFRRSTPSRSTTPSHSTTTTPSRTDNSTDFNRPAPRSGGNTVIAPVIINNGPSQPRPANTTPYQSSGSTSNNGDWIFGLIFLLILLGAGGALIYFLFFRSRQSTDRGIGELANNTVTINKLQVALLAEARSLQAQLNELSLEADTDTPEGLAALMQEAALVLLRAPENWSHVLSSSEAAHRDKAEEMFQKLSIEERSKFSAETLVNVNGRVNRRTAVMPDPNKEPAAYIVVTLLIGTEHDKPLFGEIKSTEALRSALEKITAIPSDYLLAFELLWTPQADGDSLTYDELLSEYTSMIQI